MDTGLHLHASAEAERTVFVEQLGPHQQLKVTMTGELDKPAIEALANFVARQKRRLAKS